MWRERASERETSHSVFCAKTPCNQILSRCHGRIQNTHKRTNNKLIKKSFFECNKHIGTKAFCGILLLMGQ